MDYLGITFIAMAVLLLLNGAIRGFLPTLLGLLTVVGSLVIAGLLCTPISNLAFVQNLIEDVALTIGGKQFYFLRTLITFVALFVASVLVLSTIRTLLNKLLHRVKILKILDRILGAIVGVVITWAIFGALMGFCSVGSEWFASLDQQLEQAQIPIKLASIYDGIIQLFNDSNILNTVYGTFNPIGDLVVNLIAN